jgi:hypothetical protein
MDNAPSSSSRKRKGTPHEGAVDGAAPKKRAPRAKAPTKAKASEQTGEWPEYFQSVRVDSICPLLSTQPVFSYTRYAVDFVRYGFYAKLEESILYIRCSRSFS